MDHQDWNTVTVSNRKNQKDTNKKTEKVQSQRSENLDVKLIPDTKFKTAMMQARVAAKVTQKDLANKMNLPITQIQKWENGKLIPNNKIIANISKALGCQLPRCKKIKKVND